MADGMTELYLKTMNIYSLIATSLLISFMTLTQLQLAHADDDYIEARRLHESGEILPLESILKNIRREFPGRIIEVDLETKNTRTVYEIEILGDDGIVKEVYINAKTGKILSVKEDD